MKPISHSLIALVAAAGCLFASSERLAAQGSEPSWIWAEGDPKPEQAIFVRKSFAVPATATRVLLVAAADNKVQAFVNAERRPALQGEAWERPEVADITDIVDRGGDNLVAMRVQNAGGAAGLLALIEITDADGSKTQIVTDGSWKVSDKPRKGWNQPGHETKGWQDARVVVALGGAPWNSVTSAVVVSALDIRVPQATPIDRIKLVEGFEAELLYSVPKSDQGSWVAMTIDDEGRIIVSDQYGKLYRFAPPAPGEKLYPGAVEEIPVDIGGAQGLLYAFDSLYCVLNTAEHGGRGLYRITDSDGDDQYDKKELLRKFDEVGGEHGPHAVVLGPDGESLYIVVGNQTPVTEVDHSRIPPVWGEDLLLERPIGRGFMKGTPAPGGWIAKTDPDGKEWELIATGFRNQYDARFHHHGELFTYDADMEWDMNLPWYRPTRINVVTSGAEFGWRNGGGKWPAYYPDSLPAVVDIGPGSPTGVAFGYGAKFPVKYQKAFYAADWSYGKLYAVHLEPSGSTYTATFEEFMSAQPLPLTDLEVHPDDGALYIAIGGRRVQSGLYRITYTGEESTAPATFAEPTEEFVLRRDLETMHRPNPDAVATAWPHLGHDDRFVRFAARTAIEHQPVGTWQDEALAEKKPLAAIQALVALARHGDASLQGDMIESLDALGWDDLSVSTRLELVRAYSLAFTRFGEGSESLRQSVASTFETRFPASTPELNREILQLLVYLQSPAAAETGIALLKDAPSQEEQISYAMSLRHLKKGWNRDLRRKYYEWFVRASGYTGGAAFELFVQNMKKTALENTPEADKVALKDVIEKKAPQKQMFTPEIRTFVKNWTVEDFDDLIHVGLEGNRDFANGRKTFGAATCFACHRFNQEGGAIGPDLTSVAGKFSPRDLLESIVDPSKEISDQYGQMIFEMKDGSVIMGRIMNLSGDVVRVNTDMSDPNAITGVDRKKLKEMKPSPVSMMPPGLMNTLSEDDVLDLLAYLLSQGNPDDPMFAE